MIILTAIIPRIWLISNPSLGDNDEKYHALVAKNLTEDPLKPVLYQNPILPYDINNWRGNHLWLSKPPITLWLIAASIKCFGNTVFAVRLPSLILSIFFVLLIYHIAKLLFNRKVATISAFLLGIQGTFIELGAGEISSDHVDLTFNVIYLLALYVSLQISKVNPNKKYWYVMLLGFILGLLFLVKWHVAALILPIWISYLVIRKNNFKTILSYTLISMSIACITVAPWLIYLYSRFPLELKLMVNHLISPINQVVQGHSGPWYYYLDKIGKLCGEFIYLPILYLIYVCFSKKSWRLFFLLSCIIIPIIAFSFVETKRFTYVLITAPAIFIAISHFISDILLNVQWHNWVKNFLIIGLIALPIRFSIERVDFFSDLSENYQLKKEWKQNLINSINENDHRIVIFSDKNYIETMFYTKSTSYPIKPKEKTISQIKSRGFNCYSFNGQEYVKL